MVVHCNSRLTNAVTISIVRRSSNRRTKRCLTENEKDAILRTHSNVRGTLITGRAGFDSDLVGISPATQMLKTMEQTGMIRLNISC